MIPGTLLLSTLSGYATAADYNGTLLSFMQHQMILVKDIAADTKINSDEPPLLNNGSGLLTTVNSDGYQDIFQGGEATATTLNANDVQNIYRNGRAISTTINNKGTQYVSGGSVISTINNGGEQTIEDGGIAIGTIVNARGTQRVRNGNVKFSVLNSASKQYVSRGGLATYTTVNSGARQHVFSGGVIRSTTLKAGGFISVADGATATGVQQLPGSAIFTITRSTLTGTNVKGDFSIRNGVARNILLDNGGNLTVSKGDTAWDTTINAGGTLNISDGGILNGVTTLTDGGVIAGNTVINDGDMNFSLDATEIGNGNLTGSGQLTKSGTGSLILGGVVAQKQINLNAGSLVMDGLQAKTNIIAQAGTSLSLIHRTTLTGFIDPTDVSIDSSSTWNLTDNAQVNNLTHAGSITFVPAQGSFTPHTLTVKNLTGKGGTVTLNSVLGDSSSPGDKIVIDGGRATGNSDLKVRNHGGLGAQTTGSGIVLVKAIHGATTDEKAFRLKQPIKAGAYVYSLYRNVDQSWYLTSQQMNNDSPRVNYRDAMWSYTAMPSLSLDYDRLVAGTADTRFNYAPESRIWGRVATGQLHKPGKGGLTEGGIPASNSTYRFLQLGGDLWQLDNEIANWRAGVYGATGLMRSDVWREVSRTSAGSTRDTVYTGGVYLSGHLHSGLHLSSLLQVSRHSLNATSNDGTQLSTNGTGWLASAEAGQTFFFTRALTLEPQLQYTIQGLGMNDGRDSAASLHWSDSRRQSVRVSLKLGTYQDAKTTLAWWVAPSLTQSYGGHSGFTASVPAVTASDTRFRSNLSGTRAGLNAGLSARIRQNTALSVQGGWSTSLNGSETGGYYGLVNLTVSFG
ncbi:antigen 43 [Izhakiella capsodis]|uniref:Antigen 43 n=1 Tax=Izhakiella capsodis TaxID=1367852 RepID=A0A1I4W032_9GAMM|nr:AIDA repeat-containing protein [Izhakiella capsodis]SFN06924.1 antigen 43 [Izhakiella capsodis]